MRLQNQAPHFPVARPVLHCNKPLDVAYDLPINSRALYGIGNNVRATKNRTGEIAKAVNDHPAEIVESIARLAAEWLRYLNEYRCN